MNYFRLYRGYVVANDDRSGQNPYLCRIKVAIPEVYGEQPDVESLPWAWPCIQGFSGGIYDSQKEQIVNKESESATKFGSGMVAIPSIGATVWIQFEQGDPQFPVYMGTWIGNQQELPQAAKTDSTTGTQYPKIFVIKMPWAKDMYLRAVSDKIFELNFGDMNIRMKGESSSGAADGKMSLTSVTSDIEINTSQGNVKLHGKTVEVLSDNNMTVRAGTFKTNSVTGEREVDIVGSMVVEASENQKLFGWKKNIVSASKYGEIQGGAPKSSGFEKHPKDGVIVP